MSNNKDFNVKNGITVEGGNITLNGTGRIQGIDTVSAGTDAASKTYVDTAVANLVASAPAALDTLNELAAALGNDASFSTTVTNALAAKAPLTGTGASGTWSISITGNAGTVTNGIYTTTNFGGDVSGTYNAIVVADDSHSHAFNNLTAKTSGTGTYTTSGDFRAPIFYDSDNTSYYLNPNGGSLLYNTTLVGSAFRASADTYGYNFLPTSGGGSSGGGWARSFNFMDGGTATNRLSFGALGGVNTIDYGYLAYGTDATNYNSSYYLRFYSSGFTLASHSMRAPIFYDSDDTNFYIDLAGNSKFKNIYVRNTSSTDSLLAYGSTFGYSSSYKTLVIGNEAYTTTCIGVDPNSNLSGSFNGNGSGVEVMFKRGVYFISPNSSNNSYDSNLYMGDGYAASPGSLRAPIFYDTNNTAYFLDAAGNSVFSAFNIGGGEVYFYGSATNTVSIRTGAGGAYKYFTFDASGNFYALNGSVYGDTFYDQANTAYYANPAGTSVLNVINLPAGSAAINTTTPGATSYQLNFTGQSTADYAQAITWAWQTSGAQAGIYVQSSGSYGTKMYLATTDDFGVGSKTALTIDHFGIVTTNRNYLQATGSLRAPIFYDSDNTAYYVDPSGYSQLKGTSIWFNGTGYYAAFEATNELNVYDSSGVSADMYLNWRGGNVNLSQGGLVIYRAGGYTQATGSLRAPIFYDSGNTAYYVDPASMSNMAQASFQNYVRITNSGGAQHLLMGNQDSGGTNSPAILTSANRYFEFGYGNTWTGDGGTKTYYSYMGSDFARHNASYRAPIFYDSDDTNYYFDGTSGTRQSRFLTISGGGSGVYGNELVVGATSVQYTLEDGNLRPIIQTHGAYPVVSINHTVTTNENHGPTLQFTCNGVGNQFVIGTTGNGQKLSMGFSSASDWNPHNGISGYNGTSFFEATASGYVGIGAPGDWGTYGGGSPAYHLHFKGYHTAVNGYASVFQNQTNGTNNGGGFLFQNDYGNHSWGMVSEFRIYGGNDRPSISFSSAQTSTTWSIGYVYTDDNFRITQNHGHRHGSWGTARLLIDTSGNMYSYVSTRSPIFYDSDNTAYYFDGTNLSKTNQLTRRNSRVNSSEEYPLGHHSAGETVFEIDPTWSETELRNYFNSSSVSWVTDSTAPGGYAISVSGAVNVGGEYQSGFPFIPVDQDDIFYMEIWVKGISGTANHYVGSNEYNESFASLGGNPGSFGYWVMQNNAPGATWTKYVGYITGFGNSLGQFESGTKYFTPMALFNYSGGTSYISGWKIIKVSQAGNRTIIGKTGSQTDNSTYALDVYHPTNYRQLRVRAPGDPLIKFSGSYNGGNGGEYWQNSSGFLVFNINGSTAAFSAGGNNLRTSVYYDVDNTAYYADPTGTSVFSGLTVGGSPVMRGVGQAGATNINWNTLGDNQNTIYEITQETFNIGTGSGNSNYPTTASYKYGTLVNFGAVSSARAQMYISHAGNDLIFRGGWGTASWQTWNKVLTDQNYTSYAMPIGSSATNSVDVRAPIFYDSNDTGYYFDGASTTRMYVATPNYIRRTDHHLGFLEGSYNSVGANDTKTNPIYTIGSSYNPSATSFSNMYGCGYSHSNILGGSTGWSFYAVNNGTINSVLGASYSWFVGSARAPMFYDSDNTSYYIDPSSTGFSGVLRGYVLFGDYGAGIVGSYSSYRYQLVFAMGDSYKGSLDGTSVAGGYGLWYSHPNAGGVAANLSTHGLMNIVNGSWHASLAASTRAVDDMRAPIFYDLNNTGYYVDPASTTLLNDARANIFYQMDDTINRWDAGYLTLRNSSPTIYFRDTDHSSAMLHCNSNLFYILRGGTDTESWTQVNSVWPMYIELNTNNAYFGGLVQAVSSHRAPVFYDSADTAWYVNPDASSRVSGTFEVVGAMTASASITSTSSMFSPIYYDNDNSGYYINPASASNISTVNAVEYRRGANVIRGAANANWLSLWFDAAGADRFHFGSDGNFWVGLWGAWVSDQWRSSIYYDYNNTGYYVNPDGESVLNTLTLFGELNLSASGINYIDHSGTIYFRNQSGYATSATLTTGGDFTASGNVTAYSDARLKENIETVSNALDLVSAMRGVTYTRKDTGSEGIGVIAQEMLEVLPQVVQQGEDGTLSVAYGNLVGVLIEAIKEQQSQITALEAKVEAILAKLK